MSLDFEKYLLASSPVELQLPGRFFRRRSGGWAKADLPEAAVRSVKSEKWGETEDFDATGYDEWDVGADRTDGFGLTKCQDRSGDVERILSWQLAYSCNTDDCHCVVNKNKSRHKVSFVDDEQLASVRVIHEATDEPPLLRQFSSVNESQTAKQSSALSVKINFDQPIGNYLAFYRKLSQNYVSLENVLVVSDLQLVGTVKTKNIGAVEKSVVLRFTSDRWSSFSDIACKGIQNNVATCQYDTYEFSVTVPKNVKPETPNLVQFAICYTADKHDYWDNNGGQNYGAVVVEATSRSIVDNYLVRETSCEFATWSDANIELPYW